MSWISLIFTALALFLTVELCPSWQVGGITKRTTLNADQKNLDVQKAVHEIAPHVDREGYYEEVTTASFLAPYSQLVANRCGNLSDTEPLLLGDDSVLANEDDDVLLEEDFIDGQSDEIENCN